MMQVEKFWPAFVVSTLMLCPSLSPVWAEITSDLPRAYVEAAPDSLLFEAFLDDNTYLEGQPVFGVFCVTNRSSRPFRHFHFPATPDFLAIELVNETLRRTYRHHFSCVFRLPGPELPPLEPGGCACTAIDLAGEYSWNAGAMGPFVPSNYFGQSGLLAPGVYSLKARFTARPGSPFRSLSPDSFSPVRAALSALHFTVVAAGSRPRDRSLLDSLGAGGPWTFREMYKLKSSATRWLPRFQGNAYYGLIYEIANLTGGGPPLETALAQVEWLANKNPVRYTSLVWVQMKLWRARAGRRPTDPEIESVRRLIHGELANKAVSTFLKP